MTWKLTDPTPPSTLTLEYGYDRALIPQLRAAWGGRFIVTQDGHVDLPWDRHGFAGPEHLTYELKNALNKVGPMVVDHLKARLRDGDISTRERRTRIIFESRDVIIVGNANASAGYFYAAGWMPKHIDPGHKTRGLERVFELIHEEEAKDLVHGRTEHFGG